MAEFPQLKALYQAFIGSTLQRYTLYPTGAGALGTVGVQAVSDGAAATQVWSAYVQIVAAAVITDPCWLVGMIFSTPITDAPLNCDYAIASGGAGAEVDLVEVPLVGYAPTAVGQGIVPICWLPFPIKILGSPRMAVRIRKLSAASATGSTLKIICMTGLGT